MTDEQDQAEHARIYGEVSRQLMRVAVDFARGVSPTLSPLDVAKIYAATGAWLAMTVVGAAGAAALLRQLADALERDDDTKPN